MHSVLLIFLALRASALMPAANCNRPGIHAIEEEPTSTTSASSNSATIAFPYPTTIVGITTNVTGHQEDGTKIIEWDDAWWPPLTDDDLRDMGIDPEEFKAKLSIITADEGEEDDVGTAETYDAGNSTDLPSLVKRASGRKCGPRYQYNAQRAYDAQATLLQHLRAGTSVPDYYGTPYPHYFGGRTRPQITWSFPPCNVNEDPCTPKNLYPILRNGRPFSHDAMAGTDRVVNVRYLAGNIYRYGKCGLMTHQGAPGRNNFKLCT